MSANKLLRFIKQCFCSVCFMYFPVLITLSFVIDADDSFWGSEGVILLKLLMFSLVSFPIYISVIGVARFIFAFIERKSRPLWEVVVHGVLLVPCLCCFASWIYIRKLMPVTILTTVILLLSWAVIGTVKIILLRRPPYWISYMARLIGSLGLKSSETSLPKPLILTPLFWLITVLISALICTGCIFIANAPDDDVSEASDFICSAKTDKDSYLQGETGTITTELLNRSGETYTYYGAYSDYRPTVRLVHAATGTELPIDELPATDDHGTYKIYSTEIRFTEFHFTVPDNAKTGEYDLYISFKDYSTVLNGAMTVTEKN